MDTVDANISLGLPVDLRHYGVGAQILVDLGVRKLRLLTNNPRKVVGLESHGLELVERVSIEAQATDENRRYLTAKRERLGHILKAPGYGLNRRRLSADDPFGDVPSLPSGAGLRIGIVASRFNRTISERLLAGARSALAECGVAEEAIQVVFVPGAPGDTGGGQELDRIVRCRCRDRPGLRDQGGDDPLRGGVKRGGERDCKGRSRHRCSRNERNLDHREPDAGQFQVRGKAR